MIRKSIITLICILPLTALAQASRLGENVQYSASLNASTSTGEVAPLWFTANRYGLGTDNTSFGYLRAGIQRNIEDDSLRNWKIGYGADLVGSTGMDRNIVLQQLYTDIQWKKILLSIGQKERQMEFKNNELSSGAMTSGINARPLPQIRLEIPEYISIPGTKGWIGLKAHLAFGIYTDNKWQKEFTQQIGTYSANSLYHSKALFLKIGNEQKFPLSLSGGLEVCSQFGGEIWGVYSSDGMSIDPHQKIGWGLKQFSNALFFGGDDITDGDFSNRAGNQLGSWHARLDYKGSGWKAGLYIDHFFEDESQLFWQYGWKDMLIGLEVNLPKNRIINTLVYEHIGTKDQSGPVYHDATDNLPTQMSGSDEYYNHGLYGAWQHSGMTMGNPLLLSPLYNKGEIYVFHNRINAHHIGLSGQPCNELSWRMLYTHEKSWGTYLFPLLNPMKGNFLLAELTYSPKKLNGLSITGSYGHNDGELLGNSNGAMLTIKYQGAFNKKKQ